MISILHQTYYTNIFSPSLFFFNFWNNVFWRVKDFTLEKVQLLNFLSYILCFLCSKNFFLKLKVNKAFLLCFYSFIVLAFKFRYDPFQLKFLTHCEVRFIVYFMCVAIKSSLHQYWKDYDFLLNYLGTFVKKSIDRVFVGLPDSILLHWIFFFC